MNIPKGGRKPVPIGLPTTRARTGVVSSAVFSKVGPSEVLVSHDLSDRTWGGCLVDSSLGLFVGSHADALNEEELKRRGIGGIVNIAAECADIASAKQVTLDDLRPNAEGLSVLRLNLLDHSDENIAQAFFPAAEFTQRVTESGRGVLVHCRSGVSRAPTVAAAILMLLKGKGAQTAQELLSDARPQASMNVGFGQALEDFEGKAVKFLSCAAVVHKWNKKSDLLRAYREGEAAQLQRLSCATEALTAAVRVFSIEEPAPALTMSVPAAA
eukprot:TRINITY_DN9195_c0_g1_i1.p1 TRINITY_DN9195_c0_g1~~TRINITY_DN9195_c0_g1_i1.p1  ORF type:complete len:270 (+),score=57.99 TRINITY_DN9195_c0_g1_i1:68-877(+)